VRVLNDGPWRAEKALRRDDGRLPQCERALALPFDRMELRRDSGQRSTSSIARQTRSGVALMSTELLMKSTRRL
jgi:hypothetical protein